VAVNVQNFRDSPPSISTTRYTYKTIIRISVITSDADEGIVVVALFSFSCNDLSAIFYSVVDASSQVSISSIYEHF
jgi:hypothetical protein